MPYIIDLRYSGFSTGWSSCSQCSSPALVHQGVFSPSIPQTLVTGPALESMNISFWDQNPDGGVFLFLLFGSLVSFRLNACLDEAKRGELLHSEAKKLTPPLNNFHSPHSNSGASSVFSSIPHPTTAFRITAYSRLTFSQSCSS